MTFADATSRPDLGPWPGGQNPVTGAGDASCSERDAATACVHCGLPLGRHHRADDGPFCCRGCKTVFELIHTEGLERFYELCAGATAPPGELRSTSFAWLAGEWEQATPLPGGDVRRLQLDVQGVHCAACVWLLEQLFARHAGGRSLRINPALGSVDLVWDAGAGELVEYLTEVERFGYRFGPARKQAGRRSRALLVRLGLCTALALNVMSFSLAFYFGLAPADGVIYELFGRLNLALAALALVIGGWPFIAAAWRGLRHGLVHLDLPIALGMLLAFAGSTVAYVVHGPEAAYFDTITIFIALMLVGRWLQEHVLERNRNTLLRSGGIADLYAQRFGDTGLAPVSAAEVRSGDDLWIAPGDLVPVAGLLLRQPARVSLDWITGEAEPVACQPGGRVVAGAINVGEHGFRLSALENFGDSRLHDLLAVDDGTERRSAGTDWWHRVATFYVLAVLSLATLGFVLWWPTDARKAVEVSVAVLVVTCPCALGLAVPLGRELVHVALRRRGVMLRREGFLERALDVRQIVFDKTGTLTRGRLALTAAANDRLRSLSRDEREVLWNLVSRSTHPVSRCVGAALDSITRAAGETLRPRDSVDTLREEIGRGLEWRDGEQVYRFGRPDFAAPDAAADADSRPGTMQAVFSLGDRSLVELEFVEELRGDATAEVDALRRLGYAVHLLSGDAKDRVAAIASQLDIPAKYAHGELTPEQKAAAVAELDDDDTLMVGDGLNDSLSFDRALCSATPAVDRAVLPQKADFYFLGDGIGAVRRALQAARRLRVVQRGNLVFAVVYNLLAVVLCLSGRVSPVVAAILMPLSSISIVALTTSRLARKEASWMS